MALMVTELGHFALILAFLVSLVQATVPMAGAELRRPGWMALAEPAATLQFLLTAFAFGALMHGFIISDFFADRPAFLDHARPLVAEGKIRWKDDIVDGLEGAPEAFLGLLEGRNFGKVLVRV